jgi:16S rRNA (cytosine1402-N4)-methyltransferase
MSGNAHAPVLLGPVIEGLDITESGTYVDATFGRGGHSRAILGRLGASGRLIAIDRDPQAVSAAPAAIRNDPRFEIIRSDFAQLARHMDERQLTGEVDGLLLDLGVSSPQLDEPGRGFSFRHDGPLDMRMDPDAAISAAEFLRTVDEKTLARVIRRYGEESLAPRIARAIVARRREAPIERTGQLADIVAAVVPAHGRRTHPATRTFQAIRIFINDELHQLERVLGQSLAILRKGGRLCVISFHSLEDRIVKRFMREHSLVAEPYRGLPDVPLEFRPKLRLIGKVLKASAAEVAANPRARSARLRVAERT